MLGKSLAVTVALVSSLAETSAYHTLTNQDYAPILLPDLNHPLTRGQPFTVEWDTTWNGNQYPTQGLTVSLVLCHGPADNCVLETQAFVSGIPAAQQSYTWNVPCSEPPGTQNTASGYGMVIVVDQTGDYQYSTQFSVLQGSC